MLHPTKAKYTLLASSHETFTNTNHILHHKTHLNKLKRTEILQSLLSDLTEIKQEVNNLPRDTSLYWDSLVTQIVESLPAIQETQI